MNCAVHVETPATAYCRTCGKALCERCSREVRGVLYCEECLAARLQDIDPAASRPAPAITATAVPSRRPSPGGAAVLAAIFPFGIGAIYNGLYTRGLINAAIFIVLVFGASHDVAEPLFGLLLAFFYFYQIFEAHQSAKAIGRGQPAPDPFGLERMFSQMFSQTTGTSPASPSSVVPTASPNAGDSAACCPPSRVPIRPLVLIGIGVLFLLSNMGLFPLRWLGTLWPLILVAIGVMLLLRRRGTVQNG